MLNRSDLLHSIDTLNVPPRYDLPFMRWKYLCMYVWMDGCTYVYMYVSIPFSELLLNGIGVRENIRVRHAVHVCLNLNKLVLVAIDRHARSADDVVCDACEELTPFRYVLCCRRRDYNHLDEVILINPLMNEH